MCHSGNTGDGTDTKELVHKIDSGEEDFRAAPAGILNSQPFDHESDTLTYKLSQLPYFSVCLLISSASVTAKR